jgi:two-component sensor histidine kinase
MALAHDAPLSLGLAVIASSNSPLLLLDGSLAVIAASASFCRAFGVDAATISGRPLLTLGAGEWAVDDLRTLLERTAAGQTELDPYEMELIRDGHETLCLVLHAQKLEYDDPENVRLLLAVSDVTEARTADKLKHRLVEEKNVLLREIQHRIANSLQIIASVLMQSARQVQAEEARTHLTAAYGRVMSIAAVQNQLATSGLRDVDMRTYLVQLCHSLGDAMIGDRDKVSIETRADDDAIPADASVSMGLITTELVINALKHAFPEHTGKILVDYRTDGPDWILSVQDDGVGIPREPAASPGLGTGIIEALARQLGAGVVREDMHPGTKVSIVHTHAAGTGGLAPDETRHAA